MNIFHCVVCIRMKFHCPNGLVVLSPIATVGALVGLTLPKQTSKPANLKH